MNPLLPILLLPIAEIATFIEVGDWIGTGPTIALILLSAVAGMALVRWQGLSVLRRAQESARRGEVPMGAVFEGFCVVAGGILLIIPGFLTDIVGILLLIPFLRNALGRWLFERMRGSNSFQVWTGGPGGEPFGRDPHPPHHAPPGVIDVEYREVDPDPNTDAGAGTGPGAGSAGDGEGRGDEPRLGDSRWAPPDSRFRGDRP